jgi:hypothetical protein
MTYTGEVKHCVVVLEDAPQLKDGARVREEVEAATTEPVPGSVEAVLSRNACWQGPDEEIDKLLADLKKMKAEELRLQLSEPVEEL